MNLGVKLFHLFAGLGLGAVGLVVGVLGLIGILDPVGAKMADDSDPFGPTTGIVPRSLVMIFVSIAVIAAGAYLIWRIDKKV